VQKIAQAEKIIFKEERFIDVICQQGQGSVRDTLSLLEQVLSFAANRTIDEDGLAAALGMAKESMIKDLGDAIYNGQIGEVRTILKTALEENVTAKNIFKALLDYYYRMIDQSSSLEGALLAERLWIYEVLAQDAVWALAALHPEQALELVLIKLTQRRSFFQDAPPAHPGKTPAPTELRFDVTSATPSSASSSPSSSAAADEKVDPSASLKADGASAPSAVPAPARSVDSLRRWSEFLAFVGDRSPSLRANLEQGNLLGQMLLTSDQLAVNIGLGPTEKVFWEYLQDHDIHQKICRLLGEFFSLAPAQIELKLTLLTPAQKQELNFRSLAEQGKEDVLRQEDSQEASLRNDPVIKEAEHLFHAEVDKVILASKSP
jgi:DNA polymerase-3 subunit gamma/tau